MPGESESRKERVMMENEDLASAKVELAQENSPIISHIWNKNTP